MFWRELKHLKIGVGYTPLPRVAIILNQEWINLN